MVKSRVRTALAELKTKAWTVSWRWLLSNPRVVYRIMRGFFRALVLGKNTLRTIDILPTFDCQAKCTMCSVAKFRKGHEGLLATADYESVADQAAKMGAVAVAFLGGEPLLAENICELVRIFDSRGFFVSLVSNGLAMTPEYAERLRTAGLDAVYFGLESIDEEVNDRLRNHPGQCRQVLNAAEICKDKGLLVGISTVFMPGARERTEKLLQYCGENDLRVFLATLAPVGAAKDMAGATEASYEELVELLDRHPHLSVDWSSSYFLRRRCPAGKEKLVVTCYGNVLGCCLNHISFGNVKEEPLHRIWQRAMAFSPFREAPDRCIAGFDRQYQEDFLAPIAEMERSPVSYKDHPAINPTTEPDLFPDDPARP